MDLERPSQNGSPPPLHPEVRGRGLETVVQICLTLAVTGTLYQAFEAVQEIRKERAQKAFDALPLDLRSTLLACDDRYAVLFYDVQHDDTLHGIARAAGLVPFYRRVPPDVLKPWNPIFNDGNEGFPGRNPNDIYGYQQTDVLALPNTPGVLEFLKEAGQFPYPGAPENILAELESVNPDVYASLENRAKAVVALFATNNPEISESKEELRDLCIFLFNKKGRELSYETVREVLAEYTLEYLHADYIRFMLDEHLPIFLPRVNQLLINSGVSHTLPENVGDNAIFTAVQNSVGGGFSPREFRPFFVVLGNYAHPSDLLAELNMDTDNIFRRTLFHEALHTIQPPSDNLTISEWNFAHSAMGFVTLPSEYWSSGAFRSDTAVDPRVQIVYQRLVESGIEKHDAYKMIVKASIDFEGLAKIKDIYNSSLYFDDEMTFDEMFINKDLDYENNQALKDYVTSSRYQIDFSDLLQTMTDIIQLEKTAPENDGHSRDFSGRKYRGGELFDAAKGQGRTEFNKGRFRGSKPVRMN